MARTPWIRDEVWAGLDPRAGRLSPRGRWALAGAAVLVVAAIAGLWLVQSAGVVRPRLGLVDGAWREAGWLPGSATVSLTVDVADDAWTGARVTGVSSPAGLRATRVEAVVGGTEAPVRRGRTLPVTIPAGGHAMLTVHYAVADCANPPANPRRMSIDVARWWGTARVGFALSSLRELPSLAAAACAGRR